MAKKEINGKVVLYVEGRGAVVAEACTAIHSDTQPGACHPDFYRSTLGIPKGTKYMVVGIARLKPRENIYQMEPAPHIIDEALNYTRTKFFRLMLDLMRLAQFDPYNGGNAFGTERFTEFGSGAGFVHLNNGIDYSGSVDAIDAQLFEKYGFSAAMIDFINRKYGDGNDGTRGVEGER